MTRFLSLERRLARNKDLQQKYVEFMTEYEELGHMHHIDEEDIMAPSYFIPHHCVLKPASSTTKLRVVFDASAKTHNGISLNDLMMTGPVVQSELYAILLRFRMPRFVFTTDIEKMYRQIRINEADQNLQLIFWRSLPDQPIKTCALDTITYGTAAAPYLATKCLQHLALLNGEKFPQGAKTLLEDFYVDDGISGSDNLTVAVETRRQLSTILESAGFKLRKWCANHPQLLHGIAPEDKEVNLDFDEPTTKTLGLVWLPKFDHLQIKVELSEYKSPTKRSIASDISKIFDPLGLVSPVVVTAKIFMQQLWQEKRDWDEPLSGEIITSWNRFKEGLQCLNTIKIPRHVFDHQRITFMQLHVFVDASEKAFGAAAYIRAKTVDGRIQVRLLSAKSKVAPLNKLTLPRLELSAAVLGAHFAARIRRDLRLENTQVYFWSDSEIVLSWINSTSANYHTFVANRIAQIQQVSMAEQWRHVRSRDNPADIVSRGISPEALQHQTTWFYGPIFLNGSSSGWPQPFKPQLISPNIEDALERRERPVKVMVASEDDILYKIQHSNSFMKLQRIISYMYRLRAGTSKSSLVPTTDELDNALHVIIRNIQAIDFKCEIQLLRRHEPVQKNSPLADQAPFLDEKGIIRVGGRLKASPLPYDSRHPIALPYNDSIVRMLLKMLHEDNMYCGPQTLLATSRQRFWIIKGKSMARSIVQNCVRCQRAKPMMYKQMMGNLPAARVTPARPFLTSGVDYCGPFWVHYKIRGKRPHKAYIALFCCFVTKAVHLELVTELTTDAFIGALRRFISRRGRCDTIYSDNATNFVGAKNKLEELADVVMSDHAQKKILKTCSEKGIQFKFIPPRAPHFGGLWEAAVKSAKYLLLRSVATTSLTYEELETVMIEAEAVLNSRSLTPLSSDSNDHTLSFPDW